MRINRDNLQEGMFLETLQRGEEDLGFVIKKEGILYAQFNQCTVQIQSHFNKQLFAKGFEGDHVMSVRMATEIDHFCNPKNAPLICSREFKEDFQRNYQQTSGSKRKRLS